MATQAFSPAAFQALFPEFAATAQSTLTSYATMASSYLDVNDSDLMSGPTLLLALNLLTAHLARAYLTITAGQSSPSVVQSATEGGVTVSLLAPPAKSGWQWWLATTPYGQQLWALLQSAVPGGTFAGGSYERQAFRKTGGVF